MPIRAALGVLVTVIAIFSALVGGHAQDRSPVIGSPTAGEHRGGWVSGQEVTVANLALEELTADQVADERLAAGPLQEIGPFDASRYGFSAVEVYFNRTLPEPDERLGPSSNGTLRLVVATRAPDQRRRWWSIPLDDSSDFPAALVTDEPSEEERVRPATGDASLPIVDIRWTARQVGMHFAEGRRHHLLLDLRASVPQLLAMLDDIEAEGWGWCGGQTSPVAEIGCRWEGSDFFCAKTHHLRGVNWGHRRASRRFWLLSDETIPIAKTLYRHPSELLDAARTPGPVTIEGFGDARVVAEARMRHGRVKVAASPLLSEHFGVALFAGAVGRKRQADHGVVRAKRLAIASGASDDHSENGFGAYTPDSADPLAVHVRQIARDGDLTVLQLTVTEGRGRGVYLVGLQLSEQDFKADAVLIATDATTHDECLMTQFPKTAVAMTLRQRPFAASLDVEPINVEERTEDDIRIVRGPTEPDCPTTTRVTWKRETGFVLDHTSQACSGAPKPRRVAIEHDGALHVKP